MLRDTDWDWNRCLVLRISDRLMYNSPICLFVDTNLSYSFSNNLLFHQHLIDTWQSYFPCHSLHQPFIRLINLYCSRENQRSVYFLCQQHPTSDSHNPTHWQSAECGAVEHKHPLVSSARVFEGRESGWFFISTFSQAIQAFKQIILSTTVLWCFLF